MAAFPWRAQYYEADGILVEDYLTFTPDAMDFQQNLTAYPFQTCDVNSVVWTGEYVQANATALYLSYIRCTPTGAGCLRCEPTRSEWAQIEFHDADDCDSLALTHDDGVTRFYFAFTAQ